MAGTDAAGTFWIVPASAPSPGIDGSEAGGQDAQHPGTGRRSALIAPVQPRQTARKSSARSRPRAFKAKSRLEIAGVKRS
jgi:hypothetical protein